jgi:hypothetical protein
VRCDAFNALCSARAFFAFPSGYLNHQVREFVAVQPGNNLGCADVLNEKTCDEVEHGVFRI